MPSWRSSDYESGGEPATRRKRSSYIDRPTVQPSCCCVGHHRRRSATSSREPSRPLGLRLSSCWRQRKSSQYACGPMGDLTQSRLREERRANICCLTGGLLHVKVTVGVNGVDKLPRVERRRRSCRLVGREENHNVVSGGLNRAGAIGIECGPFDRSIGRER